MASFFTPVAPGIELASVGTAGIESANAETGNLAPFVDRRTVAAPVQGTERRQFTNSHVGLSPAARELAEAIDCYKVQHRRRYITFEEMLQVIQALGYEKLGSV